MCSNYLILTSRVLAALMVSLRVLKVQAIHTLLQLEEVNRK